MAYVECKIWPYSISLYDYVIRGKVMKEGRIPHYTTKALIDTSSCKNFIRKSVVDKLGIKYNIPPKDSPFYDPNVLGFTNLELSFQYKGEDSLVWGSDDTVFGVVEDPKADLVFGLQWLWLREAKIDILKGGIRIYGNFVPFVKK
ncbi:unnamed protein product [Rhizophagus irregularis]|nr:unnamed protein product [Rhizophagus irregularis]CAB5328491.1 unnamed protein product [Rhizophagus irregularis]